MGLKSDDYDPTPAIEKLREELRLCIGEPVYRMIRPEAEEFLQLCVAGALLRAFSKAEALCINDMVKQADQSSRNMLEAVMAGAEVERITQERTTKQDIDH